jgi:hypothetical protein
MLCKGHAIIEACVTLLVAEGAAGILDPPVAPFLASLRTLEPTAARLSELSRDAMAAEAPRGASKELRRADS